MDAYLADTGHGRSMLDVRQGHVFFSMGDPADSVFFLHDGRVKISVYSTSGKEATVRLVSPGDFFGERAMLADPMQRLTRATAMTDCMAVRICRSEFVRLMREEPAFSMRFSTFLLECSMRAQADLVDQIFNRAEKRLARLLLLLAEASGPGEDSAVIPVVSQAALASMIGSTRSRVNGFMNRFRKLGYIEYKSRIHVRRSLLEVFLRD